VTAPYYTDEYVTLYHGDCLEVTDWLSADVLVTDPPYGIGYRRGSNEARGSKHALGIVNDEDTSTRDKALAAWGDGPAVLFGSLTAPYPSPLRQVLIWQKPANAGVYGSTTGYRRDIEAIFLCGSWPVRSVRSSSVLRLASGSGNGPGKQTGHPHAKPFELMLRLIEPCPPGTIADPFAGSGSTLVAAKLLGRRAIGVEIDERYCEIAAGRLSQEVLDL